MPELVLTARYRTETGKGPAGRLREEGLLPAVFYGRNQEARPITVNYKEFKKVVFSEGAGKFMFKIDLEGEEKTVMLKGHQIDPIRRASIHADFYEVDLDRPIHFEVPVVLEGRPAGLENGGMLQQVRHVLIVSALPHKMPEQFVLDVSGLELGDSIHVEDIPTDEGVELVHETNFTVVTVIAPKGATGEEAVEGAEEAGGSGNSKG
jgi:large subunit ribosomal protein L25